MASESEKPVAILGDGSKERPFRSDAFPSNLLFMHIAEQYWQTAHSEREIFVKTKHGILSITHDFYAPSEEPIFSTRIHKVNTNGGSDQLGMEDDCGRIASRFTFQALMAQMEAMTTD